MEPSLRFAPFTGEGSVRRGSSDLPGNSLSNCMERASPEIYPLLVPLFASVAMTQASLAIEQWQVSRGFSFLSSGGNFMPMVYCLVGWRSFGQAALFQLDFSGCWSRISSCTGRADFSAALCVTVLPGRCRWCLVRTSTAVLPKRTTRPTGLQASQCTMCVWAFLGNRCMFSVLGSAPETPSGWCVGIVGTAPPGTEEVSQPSAARHVTPSTATGHCLSSTGAVKQFRQVFLNLEYYGAEHLGQV